MEVTPAPLDLAALEGLLAKATPGTWFTARLNDYTAKVSIETAAEDIATIDGSRNESVDADNAALIAAAVNALPALLARARRADDLEAGIADLRARHVKLENALLKEEREHEQTATGRDEAEEALSQAYYLIIGESPEWSNHFGSKEAIAEIDEAQTVLRNAIKAAESRARQLEEHVERLAGALQGVHDYYQFSSAAYPKELDQALIDVRAALAEYATLTEPKHD